MRRVALAALAGALVLAGGGAPARADEPVVSRTQTCLPVQAGGVTQPVYADRYTTGTPTADTPVLLLVHGVASDARIFDLTERSSVARNFARAGYVVVAYDRLGYSRSPYRGAGDEHDVTVDLQQQVLHQVVAQVKAGDYATGAHADCSAGATPAPDATTTPSSRVVLIGHSQGAFTVAGYPGRYPGDVAGMVQADAPSGATFFDANGVLQPDGLTSSDPVTEQHDAQFGDEDPSSGRQACEDFNVWAPGGDRWLVDALCGDPAHVVATPAGDGESQVAAAQANARYIVDTGATDVLQITGDRDFILPPGTAGREFNAFAGRCGCDISHAVIANTGHAFMLHTSLPVWMATVEEWLRSKGLAGDPAAPAPTPAAVAAPIVAPATPVAVAGLGALRLTDVVRVPEAGCVAGGRLRVQAVPGAARTVQRVTVLVGGHRYVARVAAITVRLRRSTRVRIGVVARDGRTAHVTRSYRPCGT